MSRTPASYNLRIQRRADFSLALQFKDSDGIPLNLTGYTVVSQVWDYNRTVKACDFGVNVTNIATGAVTLTLSYAVTETLTASEYHYDVLLIAPGGLREYYLEGIARPYEGYSSP